MNSDLHQRQRCLPPLSERAPDIFHHTVSHPLAQNSPMLLRSGLLAVGLGLGARAHAPGSALVRPLRAPCAGASLRSLATVPAGPRSSSVLAELRAARPGAAAGLGIPSSRLPVSPLRSALGAARSFSSPSSPLLQRLGRIRPKRIAIPIQGAAEAGGLPEQSIFVPIVVSCSGGLLAWFSLPTPCICSASCTSPMRTS